MNVLNKKITTESAIVWRLPAYNSADVSLTETTKTMLSVLSPGKDVLNIGSKFNWTTTPMHIGLPENNEEAIKLKLIIPFPVDALNAEDLYFNLWDTSNKKRFAQLRLNIVKKTFLINYTYTKITVNANGVKKKKTYWGMKAF